MPIITRPTTGGGVITDPSVPADGTQNFTGSVSASDDLLAGDDIIAGDDITASGTMSAAAVSTNALVIPTGAGVGLVLTSDGSGNATWQSVAGTGDVVGPASATDSGIAVYDGITGKLLQNSSVTIDPSGNIATAGTVDGRDVSADGSTLDGLSGATYVNSFKTRTGAVVPASNDYTWAQIDKSTSDIADITTKSHTSLSDKGTYTHTEIDTHLNSGVIHFAETSIDHANILNKGTNTHVQIDSHISSDHVNSFNTRTGAVTPQSNDYTWAEIDKTISDLADLTTKSHTSLTDKGTYTHDQIDTHLDSGILHFTEASVDHTSIQNIGTYTHTELDLHVDSGLIHFAESSIDHVNIQNKGTNTHTQIDTHISDSDIHIANSGLDHGLLQGLSDDDHEQYYLVDGTRHITGDLVASGTNNKIFSTTQWYDGSYNARALVNSDGEFSNTLGQTNTEVFGAGITQEGANKRNCTIIGAGAKSQNFYEVVIGSDASGGSGGASVTIGHGCNGTGNYSINIGYNSGGNNSDQAVGIGAGTTVRDHSVAIGYGTVLSGSYGVVIGNIARGSTGTHAVAIGYNTDTANHSIAIGSDAEAMGSNCIALGPYATNSTNNSFSCGAHAYTIDDVWFGKGVSHTVPTGWTLHSTRGSGTDITGSTLKLIPGEGTGTGESGSLEVWTAPAGDSGSSLNTSEKRFEVLSNGNAQFYGSTVTASGIVASGIQIRGGSTNGYYLQSDADGNASWAASVASDPMLLSNGSEGAPTYSFSSDSTTGMYLESAGNLMFTAGGADSWKVNSGGHLVPADDITGSVGSLNKRPYSYHASPFGYIVHNDTSNVEKGTLRYYTGYPQLNVEGSNPRLALATDSINALYIDNSQNVGIGTTTPSTRLEVNDRIIASGIFDNDLDTGIYVEQSADLDSVEIITSGQNRLSVNEAGIFTFNGLTKEIDSASIDDDGEIILTTAVAGWGFVQAGDNEEYAQVAFTSAGVVTLIYNSTNVANTDSDGNLCIYDAGTGIAIKNRLGSTKTIRYEINYS